MLEINTSIDIKCIPEQAFKTLADLSQYHKWLSPSSTYRTIANISDKSAKLGTKYIDSGQSMSMDGEITALDPPHRITFQQQGDVKFSLLSGVLSTKITYAIAPTENGIRVDRIQQVSLQGSIFILQKGLMWIMKRENRRIMKALKDYLES